MPPWSAGARSAADWLATETRQVRCEARSDLKLARSSWMTTRSCWPAWPGGQVNVDQARAIVASLDRLPCTGEFAVTAEQRAAAEAHLVAEAAHHDAKDLRYLGGKVMEVLAPELAEKFEGKALEAEESRALRRTTFTMWEDDEGTTHGRFRIPSLHGQMLEKMILALTSPSRSVGTNTTGIEPDLQAGAVRASHDPAHRVSVCRMTYPRPAAVARPWWSP